MSNLINADVMQGLVGAYSSVQLANVSMGIYERAKTQGNEDAAQQALDYATNSMSDARKSSADAKEALLEAKETAKEDEKISQETDLERSAENAAEQASPGPPSLENQTTEIHLTHAMDRLEISEQGREAVLPTEKTADPPTEPASRETSPVQAQTSQQSKPAENLNRNRKWKAVLKTKTSFSARA